MSSFYEDLIPGLQEAKESIAKINGRFSIMRLICFLISAAFVIAGFVRGRSIPLFVVAGIAFLAFVVLCVIHDRIKKEEALLTAKLEASERYVARIKGDYSKLTDDGSEFINHQHMYTSDLDVFGPHSIFALYNISHFIFGRRRFADKLKCNDISVVDKASILKMQKMVDCLSEDPEFLLDYEAVADVNRMDKVPDALIKLCSEKKKLSKFLRLFYRVVPVLWIIPVVLFFVSGMAYARAAVLSVILINFIIWFVLSKQDMTDIFKAGMVSRQVDAVSERVDYLLNDEKRKDKYFPEYLGNEVIEDISSLKKACGLCTLRDQPIFALLLNSIMPFDLMCADKLYTWSEKHGDRLEESINGLAEIESLMCACVPGLVSKVSCFPEIVEDKKAFFDGTEMTHPLLDPSKAVSNSVTIDSKTALITGSNMSGKTTLIRTVGIMCVLSYIGSKVPARSVSTSIMKIMTSMRIADSLEENMSTFKAELIRIGSIVESSKSETPMLFLIDEVFRGTNSQDRTDGAEILLEKLDRPYISGFMTTHDYALCDRAAERDNGRISFYHFSERYEGDEVIFDYKLREGLSHESNAMFLMRLVGIK